MSYQALFFRVFLCVAIGLAGLPVTLEAAPKSAKKEAQPGKTQAGYNEDSFLKAFSGKTRKEVATALGQPARKEQSVKPANAEQVLSRPLDTSKAGNVEMWYYANKVRYDDKHTYKSTEMTFVNDRCQGIAFFNDR